MGRKSKLTESQWEEVKRKKLEGASYGQLAKEYGVTAGAIKQQIATQVNDISSLASQIVTTEQKMSKLSISNQILTNNLSAKLRAISDHLANAAYNGAKTADRLSGMANLETDKINEADLRDEATMESLKAVAALTKMANDASTIPMGLLNANKEQVSQLSAPVVTKRTLADYYKDNAPAESESK